MAAHQRKKSAPKFEGVADLLTKLEKQAQEVVQRFVDKAEQSSRELKTTVRHLIAQIRKEGIYNLAAEKKTELRKLVDEVVSRAKEIEFGNFNRDHLIHEAKKNLDELVEKVQESEWVARARVTARHTKDQVLSVLSIPSQDEVVRLSRKISTLEQKMSKLTRKAA